MFLNRILAPTVGAKDGTLTLSQGCKSGASQKILWEQVVTCSAHFTENFKTNLAEYWGAVHGRSSSLPDYLTKCFESWCSAAVVSCIGVCYQDKFWFVVYTLLRWRLPRISLTLCNLDCDAEAECFLHLQKKKKNGRGRGYQSYVILQCVPPYDGLSWHRIERGQLR